MIGLDLNSGRAMISSTDTVPDRSWRTFKNISTADMRLKIKKKVSYRIEYLKSSPEHPDFLLGESFGEVGVVVAHGARYKIVAKVN